MAADTIFALSSGAPPAAIAIIRVSGPGAGEAARSLAGAIPSPRLPTLRPLRDPADGGLLDRALLIWMPGPASATGEDLLELHVHGGRAVVESILGALGRFGGLRGAEPGEFTRRAFENGRIDLAEAEGLADLLRAETESQRRGALAMAEGGLSARVADWQTRLLALSARVEAALDFSDEDDVRESDSTDSIAAPLLAEMRTLLERPGAERLRDGVRVALAGPPNAGKSTLLNALVGRDAAIVSDIAGTTRDVIEAPVALGGIAFLFSDMAGLREGADDAIERIGIDRAHATLDRADIILWLGDDAPPAYEASIISLHPRADLTGRRKPDAGRVAVSAVDGTGLTELVERLRAVAADLLPREGELALNRRQRDCIAACVAELEAARASADPLIIAEHLRHCRNALDRLTGRAGTEEMLDALFGAFCIGK